MTSKFGSTKTRYIRISQREDESQPSSPSSDAGTSDLDLEVGAHGPVIFHDDEECGVQALEHSPLVSHRSWDSNTSQDALLQPEQSTESRWTRRERSSVLSRWLGYSRRRTDIVQLEGKSHCGSCTRTRSPLRITLKSLAIALMLLGLLEFAVLLAGFVASFFPSEIENVYSSMRSQKPTDTWSHWPTDYTTDIQPVQCHSHNDYWRSVPLKSALKAGCTGVEADVWLFPDQNADELFVGHSKSSLTPQRTFRSLYVDPLVEILESQNPNTTLHPTPDSPRNGVFDTKPGQTLVLLVDFKTDGYKLWSVVSQQLEPLRQRQYLTHFNGASVVEGPITVVVTGNAPFNKVVENSKYRDMFFDAPLELLGQLASTADPADSISYNEVEERAYLESYARQTAALPETTSNQGQGHSGAAPTNPAIYTPANSYYASVSFTKSIGFVLPYLRQEQNARIRQQIQGAHKQGLKVRYWSTPAWPRGRMEYIWRVLVEAGADYLNVDDLEAATKGDWETPTKKRAWGLSSVSLW